MSGHANFVDVNVSRLLVWEEESTERTHCQQIFIDDSERAGIVFKYLSQFGKDSQMGQG